MPHQTAGLAVNNSDVSSAAVVNTWLSRCSRYFRSPCPRSSGLPVSELIRALMIR